MGKSWNPGEKREIAEQTQTHRDSAWPAAQVVAYTGSKINFFLVKLEVWLTGILSLAGVEILEDHYGVGNVVALAIMEVKCSVD